MRIDFERSGEGYGWSVTLGVRGRHRVRWNSTKATTPMSPRVRRGADEHCNRSLSFILWPLGHLDWWWEPARSWRTVGACPVCIEAFIDWGLCPVCGSKPCDCAAVA